MTGKLYVSHTTNDAATAERIIAYLEARGVQCWTPRQDIPPSADHTDAVFEAMRNSDACAALVSATWNRKIEKGASIEADIAGTFDKPVFAIRIDDAELNTVHTYNLQKAKAQWVEFGRDGERALDQIVAYLKVSTPSAPAVRRPHPVFVSHSTKDRAMAAELVRRIEDAGQRCWMAPRDIDGGEDWNAAILRGIKDSRGLVLIVTEAALDSQFVQAEIQYAFEHKKRIVPLRIPGGPDPGRLDLRLKTVQHLDHSDEPDLIEALRVVFPA